jgi:hypothetical protein
MPTVRPRHQITETPELARSIDQAARRCPNEPRSKLLLLPVDAGGAALEKGEDLATRQRQEAIKASSGKCADAFSADYLADLRRDWLVAHHDAATSILLGAAD